MMGSETYDFFTDASIEMHRNDSGEVDALTLHQGGTHRATRLTGDEEQEAPVHA